MEPEQSNYPEHDKLDAVKDQSHAIGEFIDNLPRLGLDLYDTRTKYGDPLCCPHSTHRTINAILAEWFEINLDRLEDEKRAMLAAMRSSS